MLPTPRSPTAQNTPQAGDYGVDCKPSTALVGKTLPVFGNSFPFSFHGTFLSHRRVLAGFRPKWPVLVLTVAGFNFCVRGNLVLRPHVVSTIPRMSLAIGSVVPWVRSPGIPPKPGLFVLGRLSWRPRHIKAGASWAPATDRRYRPRSKRSDTGECCPQKNECRSARSFPSRTSA
jgi:hypothetical protein